MDYVILSDYITVLYKYTTIAARNKNAIEFQILFALTTKHVST